MKGRNLIFTALLVLTAGIILILLRNSIHSEGVVTAGGILFIVAGLLDLLVFESGRRRQERRPLTTAFNWITSAAAVILGLSMLIFRSTFAGLIPFMFGILIAFTALYQVYLLAYASRPVMLPGWLYIAPLLLAAASVYLFMQKALVDDVLIMVISGAALTLFGVAMLVEGAMLGHYHRHPQTVPSATARKDTAPAAADSTSSTSSTPAAPAAPATPATEASQSEAVAKPQAPVADSPADKTAQ